MGSLPTSTMSIRNEVRQDVDAIREVNRRAFGRDAEAELVDRLRADGDVIASLTALEGGRVVGHVMFSRLPIERDGDVCEAVALAPVAVDPDFQGNGIGSLLIMRGLDTLRRRGVAAVVVVGEPRYYEQFGFRTDLAAAIDSPYAGDACLALELDDGALAGGGRAQYPAAFADLD